MSTPEERQGWREVAARGLGVKPTTVLALLDELEAAERERDEEAAVHRDLTRRLGFGDGITEPMADNDTIIDWWHEIESEAAGWRESQQWRNECAAAGHPQDEDCDEHDPALRLDARAEAAEAKLAKVREVADALHKSAEVVRSILRIPGQADAIEASARLIDDALADPPTTSTPTGEGAGAQEGGSGARGGGSGGGEG